MAMPVRSPFLCPPGLDAPPNLRTDLNLRISLDDRAAKREQVVQGFQRSCEYQVMAILRSERAAYQVPSGDEPKTPRADVHISKRHWERAFRHFKMQCEKWSQFVEQGRAVSRASSKTVLNVPWETLKTS